MTTRLHIGCGDKFIPGFIHIDVRQLPHVDYVAPAGKLTMFADDSVDLIYCCHMLEHLYRYEIEDVLKEWYRVIKPGGTLRLAVPDFEKIVELYNRTKDLKPLLGLLIGRQDYPENTHHLVFDYNYLSGLLTGIGFSNVRRYDWRKTVHKDYDDFSQAYLPHMDKEHGTLMSLNIEADK